MTRESEDRQRVLREALLRSVAAKGARARVAAAEHAPGDKLALNLLLGGLAFALIVNTVVGLLLS